MSYGGLRKRARNITRSNAVRTPFEPKRSCAKCLKSIDTFRLIWPGAKPEDLEKALVEELNGLDTVTQAELDRSVALTETHLIQNVQQMGGRADLLSMFDRAFDDPARLNSEVDRFRAVTRAQVRDFGESFLGPDNRAFLTYIPGGSE